MTSGPDDIYLTWLYSQVGDVRVRNQSKTYWDLLGQLYSKEFVWWVPNDDNRVQDGIDLRYEWYDQTDISVTHEWLERPCSFLELLIGLSRRLAFEAEGHPPTWFWHLLENLGLQLCNDQSAYHQDEVNARLDAVIWRTYEPDGRGGLFPLRYTNHDQTQVELWYQMNEYILDG